LVRQEAGQTLARTYRALEWEALKELLSHCAETAWGRERCLALPLLVDEREVVFALCATDEGQSLLTAKSAFTFERLPDIREILLRLSAQAVLSAPELKSIKDTLTISRLTKSSLSLLAAHDFPQLSQVAPKLKVLEKLFSILAEAIDDDNEVKDTASAQLAKLRNEARGLDRKIRDQLNRIIHSLTLSKALQEPIFTQRGGRYVLPVDASQRGTISGIVHDSSASGLTVYVEPMAVVELANKVRLIEAEIEREVSRILAELSSCARLEIESISCSFAALIDLDVIMAKARLSVKYGGICPHISVNKQLHLKNAKHPLLILQGMKDVVGNDIILGGSARTMIVTGPNTGGKTVLLKTAGLLSLMLRGGLLLPVDNGSQVVIFTHVYADIGDEQSLSQSLSTFSSHMTNIVEIVEAANADSLVLLDEIGAGTDPREGAVLARAILERLNASLAATITTTHYGELKTLAYTQEGFINASLAFDEHNLIPTYKLQIGIPGSSQATKIAARLGLSEDIVNRAETLLQAAGQDSQLVIEQLEVKLKELLAREHDVQEAAAKANAMEAKAYAELTELYEKEEELKQAFQLRMEQEVKKAQELVRNTIANLQKDPSLAKAETARQELARIQKDLNWGESKVKDSIPKQLQVGQMVKVVSLNRTAKVDALPEGDLTNPECRIAVLVGQLRLKVALSDLRLVGEVQAKPKTKAGERGGQRQGKVRAGSNQAAFSEPALGSFVATSANTLNILGQRVDQALPNVERFLDQAVVAGYDFVMIIHGHGTGALKSAVRSYLASSGYVQGFRAGEPYEGADGVTVVELI
jgi:DNA mismatch repair protein MutS2